MREKCGFSVTKDFLCERRQQSGAGKYQPRAVICLLALFAFVLFCLTAGTAVADADHLQVAVKFTCDEAYQQIADDMTSDSSASLYVTVYQNGKYYKAKTVYAKDGWKADLTDCPLTDGNGKPYEYTFSVGGYKTPCFKASYTLENGVLTVTQTFQPTMDVTATVSFRNDDNDCYGRRPAADSLSAGDFMLAGDYRAPDTVTKTPGSAVTVNENGEFIITFKDVPTYYQSDSSYRALSAPIVTSTAIPETNYKGSLRSFNASTGKLTAYFDFVSKAIQYRHDIGVYLNGSQFITSKTAFDPVEVFGIGAPDHITVTLLQNGQPVDRADATVTANISDSGMPSVNKTWHIPLYNADGTKAELGDFTFDAVPSLANGTLDRHFVQKEERSSTSLDVRVTTLLPLVSQHKFKLTWDDNDNAMGLREAFPMNLLANGEVYDPSGSRTLPLTNQNTNLQNPWRQMPTKDAEGNDVVYSVDVEMDKPYYICTLTSEQMHDSGYRYSCTDTLNTTIEMKLRTQKVTVDVEWLTDGSIAESKLRPSNVLLTLYTSADGGATWKEFFGDPTYTVSNDDNWHVEWDAPYCDAEGNPLMYKVEQNDLSLYETTYSAQYPDTVTEGSETKLKVTNNYVINWDFDVLLSWDTADKTKKYHDKDETYQNSNISKLATLTISANQDYAAGDLTVRMPYQLFAYRDHTAVQKPNNCPKVECSLPMAPETSPTYAFNYSIDKHGSDDSADWELVFTNWKDISSGYNLAATLRYTIDPYYTIDCTEGVLKAVGTGKSKTQNDPTTHETDSITYRLDTGIKPAGARKYLKTLIYSGEGYDFQKYNYVMYTIYNEGVYYNQPFRIMLDEQPGENGEIVSITGSPKVTYNEATGMWETEPQGTIKNTSSGKSSFFYWTVVVRHPREGGDVPVREGQASSGPVYHNNATMRYVAADEHDGDKGAEDHLDVYDLPVSAEVNWKDYSFDFTGEIWSGSKSMRSFNNNNCGVSALQYGQDVNQAYITLTMTVNGYNLKDGYRFDFYDDAVYAHAKKNGAWTDYVRLTEKDYEIAPIRYTDGTKLEIVINLTDVDRSNGNTIDGVVPAEPFTLWGRSGSGTWEKIADFKATKPQGTYYVDGTPMSGKGYTGLRLTSPDGLQGKAEVKIYCYMNLKGSSEKLQALTAGNVSELDIVNISGHEVYTPDENGVYRWFNPLTKSSNTDAKYTGLDELDIRERGSYIYRRSDTTALYPAEFSSSITKTAGTIVYDKINSLAEVPFTISACENINSVSLPEALYKQWATDSGTFYDLLPLGYHYDESKGTKVSEAGYSGGSAILESVTVVSEDYQGSGRQLLCFKVKSRRAPGENYNKADYWGKAYASGFTIQFTAKITNDDVALYGPGNNVVTYQRGDLREIGGGYADDGHGRYDQSIFPVGEDGEYLLKDVNGTGDLTTKNTLFAYCPVKPEPLPTVQTGIRKSVRARSTTFVQNDISGLDENYTYKIAIEASKDGYTSNIIIYDVLEDEKEDLGWKGEFVSVDCREARRRGIDVKVYYSSDELNYSDEETLALYDAAGNLNARWKLLTDDVPRTDVKALAVDMRYLTTGDPLVLDTQSLLGFEVTMKAPSQLQRVEYAYNQPAYFCRYQAKGSSTLYEKLTVGNVTSVKLRDLQDIAFRKVYLDDDGNKKPLGGVQFSLYQCQNTDPNHQHVSYPSSSNSCWGTAIATMSSLADGTVSFRNLDSGVYAVYESNPPTGYDRYYSWYWVFTVDAEKGTVSDPVAYAPNGTPKPMEFLDGEWTLTNARQLRSFNLIKTWNDSLNLFGVRPRTLTFDLYRNGVLYRTQRVTVSAQNATDTFKGIFKDVFIYDEYGRAYKYEIHERLPDGYTEAHNGIVESVGIVTSATLSMSNTRLGVLELKKVMNGGNTTGAFGFTVTLKNADGTPYIPMDKEGNAVKITAHRFSTDATSFTRELLQPDAQGRVRVMIAPGETVQLLGLTYGIVWEAEEDGSNYTSVSTPDPASGTISDTSLNTVTFTNTPKPTELTLSVIKEITGGTTQGAGIPFSFEIAAVTAGAPLPVPATAAVTGTGTVEFAPIAFTRVGTYVYRISETAGNAAGYQYDASIYEVTVTVTDTNGQLNAAWTARNGTADAEKLIFTNAYSATGSLSLAASKLVNGRAPKDTQVYDFELASGVNTPALRQTKQNAGDTVTFDRIDYTVDDAGKTYQYTVKETTQDSSGLTVDKTVYTVMVSILDNGDGTLTVTPKYSNGTEEVSAMTFDNKLTGTIVLSKHVTGGTLDTDFTFTVDFTDGNGTPLAEKFPYDGSKSGTVGSGDQLTLKNGESITISGVPVGSGCTITEKGSVCYTTMVNGNAASEISFSVTEEATPVKFVNAVVTTSFTVTKEWQGGKGDKISLTLYANGKKVRPQPECVRNGDTYAYAGLPKYDEDGQKIVYSAKEHYMDGYMTIYKNISPYETKTDRIYDGGTIVNRAVTEIAVHKLWTGMSENETRPEITLTLYCDGQVIAKKPKLDKDGWYHFYNLPVRDTPYYVVETPVDGFATRYENTGNFADVTDRAYNGGTIINHKLPKTMDEQPLTLYAILVAVSLLGMMFCWKKRRNS